MTINLVLAQILNGLAFGMLYALLALGLSIIKGLLNIPNFAHGAFYALGAYVFFSIATATGSFWFGVLGATLVVATVGALIEMTAVRRLYGGGYLFQLLLLFGVALILDEMLILIWGSVGKSMSPPPFLTGIVHLGPVIYPKYYLFSTLLSAAIITGVWLFVEKTHFGALIRAGIEKQEMASALGININMLFTVAFALGAGLAALAGALYVPVVGVSTAMGVEMLAIAFVVIVIGGLGTFYGAIWAGLIVGLVQSLSALVWPQGSTLVIYIAMVLILLFRPQGLMGER